MKEVSRRTWWITVASALVLLIGTAYWGYTQFNQRQILLTQLNNKNQKAFFELVGNVENIEVLLGKSIVSSSPENREALLSDLWQKSYFAQADLVSLPIAQWNINRTARFLSQTGDYAFSLVKNGEGKLKDKEIDQLEKLHKEAGTLAAELQKMRVQAADGRLSWQEVKQEAPRMRKAGISFVDGINNVNKQLEEYPTLIYDGPFSDHVELMQPKGLTGPRITPEQAKDIAGRFVHAGNKPRFAPQRVENVNGKIPAYRVHFNPAAGTGPRAVVDVSRKGGHVVMMIITRSAGDRVLSLKQAEDKASSYLKGRGLNNMVPTYSLLQDDSAIISYAYMQKGVLVYPDLIKVKVALDNGDITGLEALGYLMSHHTRKIPEPKTTMARAKKTVNSRLKIKESKLVIIPTDSLGEKLVYEFKGDLNGDPFIVYVNAMTGREEKILKVIETKDGPMTM